MRAVASAVPVARGRTCLSTASSTAWHLDDNGCLGDGSMCLLDGHDAHLVVGVAPAFEQGSEQPTGLFVDASVAHQEPTEGGHDATVLGPSCPEAQQGRFRGVAGCRGTARQRRRSVQLNAVTVAQGRLVAVGDRYGDGERDARVLLLVDGRTWQETVDSDLGGAGSRMMRSIVATATCCWRWARSTTCGPARSSMARRCRRTTRAAAVWRSTDGRDWQRGTRRGADRPPDWHDRCGGHRERLRGGRHLPARRDRASGRWTSTDGLAWRRADVAVNTGAASRMHSVARYGQGLVAVGVALEETGDEEETGVAAV